MGDAIYNVTGSYRQTVTTGAVTVIAAGDATAGHLLALRNPTASARTVRLRSLEVEFILNTAFTTAQEVGFAAFIARTYTAAHTAATALDFTGTTGKRRASHDASILTGRIASTVALTAGTHTLDTNAIIRASTWCDAVGDQLYPRFYDLTQQEPYGIYLGADMGLVLRNTIVMGAVGVGKWHFTVEWDEGVLT